MPMLDRTPMTDHLFACAALMTADESDCYCPPSGATGSTSWEHELLAARPRHRRTLPPYVEANQSGDMLQNNARCAHFGRPRCTHVGCPRHNPHTYADSMARHATDSIISGWVK